MKTLYKRIAHAVMILVMLVSLTATVYAAEAYSFTIKDDPFKIYDTLMADHGKAVADQYKLTLMTNDSGYNPTGNLDQYALGPTVLYEDTALQIAADYANSLDNTTATQPSVTTPVTTAQPDSTTSNATQKFPDVKPDDWYYEAVNALTEGGLFMGYADGKFHPDETITVAQFATVFCRLYGLEMTFDYDGTEYTSYVMPTMVNGVLQNPRAYGERKQFTAEDAKNNPHWGYDAVYNLVWETDQYDIVDPRLMDTPITRGQLMKEMNIAITSTRRSYDYPKTEVDMSTIPDADSFWVGPISIMGPVYKTSDGDIINIKYGNEQRLDPPAMLEHPENYELYAANRTWSRSDIKLAYEYGITTGVDDNHTANPNGLVTRAQFCQMLYNAGFTHADMGLCRNNGGLAGGSN